MRHDDHGKALLIGSGALARDMVDAVGRDFFVGTYVDPDFARTPVQGLPLFTDWGEARRHACCYVLGVLEREHRERARQQAKAYGFRPVAPVVLPSAHVAGDARLAPGCLVGYNSVIGSAAELEEDVLVMFSAQVSHDTRIGESSVILHGSCIGGYARIGSGCFVGANAVIAPKLTMGSNSFIAAGAVCFKDAPPGSMLMGNPARISALAEREE